jgi:hypothetical protein
MFKCLGTTPTNQNYTHEEIKSRLKLGNQCGHSVHTILYSCVESENVKINIYKTATLQFFMSVRLGLSYQGKSID